MCKRSREVLAVHRQRKESRSHRVSTPWEGREELSESHGMERAPERDPLAPCAEQRAGPGSSYTSLACSRTPGWDVIPAGGQHSHPVPRHLLSPGLEFCIPQPCKQSVSRFVQKCSWKLQEDADGSAFPLPSHLIL